MMKGKYLSINEVAKILGMSRIAVYKKVKKGQIKAIRIGRSYAIHKDELVDIEGKPLTEEDKRIIKQAVKKTVKEYGEVLRLLGSE